MVGFDDIGDFATCFGLHYGAELFHGILQNFGRAAVDFGDHDKNRNIERKGET